MTLAMLLVAGAAAVAAGQSPAPANRPSRDWKTLSAFGLEAVGNAKEDDLRRTLREIAGFRTTLQKLVPGLRLSAAVPTTLVVFRDHGSFTEFAPRDRRGRRQRGIGGYFTARPERNYLVLPIFGDRRTTYEVALHEYVHYVISQNFREVPSWLNEGLAEFYATFDIDRQGNGIVGKLHDGRMMTLWASPMPPLRRLIGDGSDPITDASMFYAQSWLFVHYMTLGREGARQQQVLKYLELRPQTKSAEAAAREAFGATLDDLSRELERYFEGTKPALKVPGAAAAELPSEPSSPLSEADVAELKGRLLVEMEVPAEAGRYLTQALALDPAHRGAKITRGRLLAAEEKAAEAVEALEAVAKEDPRDFAAQYYLGAALYGQRRFADAIKPLEAAIKLNPRAVWPWFQVALATMALGQYEQSDSAMAQVQQLQSDSSWHYTRSLEALLARRDDAVLPEAKTYIDRAGITDPSAPYAAFYGAIAARRLNRPAEAEALLAQVARAVPANTWTHTVLGFMQGRLTADALLDKAKDGGERTEARTYAAMQLLQAGKPAEARPHLQWVKEHGEKSYTEYRLAIAELRRLDEESLKAER